MEKPEILECGRTPEGLREAVLILGREELMYDIGNNCYIEGHTMTEAGDEARHMVQDATQEGNADRLTRVLDLVHADVTERLYPFTRMEPDHPAIDNRLREKPVYGIVMHVPLSYSQTTLNLLGKLIHELMVCTATAEWLSITNPAKEGIWRAKAEAALTRIAEVRAHRRDGSRVRRKPHWL